MNEALAVLPERVVPDWHEQFLTVILPAVEAVARHRFRGLSDTEQEESSAEAIAGAMLTFVRLVRRGKDPAVFAGRLAQLAVLRVLSGRLTGCADRCNDALSRLARH